MWKDWVTHLLKKKKNTTAGGVVAQVYNPSAQEALAGAMLPVQGQSQLTV